MNKDLANWLRKRMAQIDERVGDQEDHIREGDEGQW